MSDSIIDNWEVAVSRLLDSSKKLQLLLGENWTIKIHTREGDTREIQEQFEIFKQSFNDIRSSLRPATIIPGIKHEELVDLWRELGQKDSYPVLDYIKTTIGHYEDFLDDPDCAETLTTLINFPFFKPDHWLKKEDEFPPLYIKGAGIPIWLSDRYKEAVYSYIYGFNNAAVAMCRSIVEGIMRNRIDVKYNSEVKLERMIDFFMSTIKDKEHKQIVWNTKKVRKLANRVLHDIQKPAKNNEVKDTLIMTRDFIRSVY